MSSRVVLAVALLAACDPPDAGDFDRLPVDGEFSVGLDAPAQVARDKYGIAHISTKTVADLGFVQGYVMAHDRLAQMDVLRRFGAGTLAELFGIDSAGTAIDSDLEMRMHRMTYYAEQSWAMLQANPDDAEVVTLLNRFADGVNRYAEDLRAGKWTLDPEVAVSFPIETFRPWSPVDSLVLGRYQAFALSWSTPYEIDLHTLYSELRTAFDDNVSTAAEIVARKGITRDLVRFAPVANVSTVPGFPNVDVDTGTRSDGLGKQSASRRADVPRSELAKARAFFQDNIHVAPGVLGPKAFMKPYAGSNNWAVGPSLGGGAALLGSDQHLQLPNPSIFYPTHLTVRDQGLDVIGITFPGIPGIILGSNGKVAWAATVSEHDVNDVYLEHVVACGGAECVEHEAQQKPIEKRTETIVIGALGTPIRTIDETYEVVPHHGPIIPEIDPTTHRLVPRTSATPLSVKYTGYGPTFEIRALWNLAHAQSVDDGFRALADFSYGSQNWTMIDDTGSIAWTTNAIVPHRSPATYAWNAETNRDGAAPFFILDGRGGYEWEGRMSSRYVPHAVNPPQGYLATANADPVGATFDNDPLGGVEQPIIEGRPLYAGISYAAGVREERITQLILSGGTAQTLEQMAAIQHDNFSTIGAKLAPSVVTALARLDSPSGPPSDLGPYIASLSVADKAKLVAARTLLAAWTYDTPIEASPDGAATAVLNTWMHYFLKSTLADELTAANGFALNRLGSNVQVRIAHAMLTRPATFKLGSTGQPILCDRMGTTGADDSCSKMILAAMLEAMTHLEGRFASANTATWAWGKLHQQTFETLFPNPALRLGPFEKRGDNLNVNRSDHGWADTNFSQFADGPAQRFLAIARPGEPIDVRWQLPGGVIFDSRDRHYRDLLDNYYLPQVHFDAPYSVDEIVADGEYRWDFR
ncbi:MAG: penicillin acylase family protein [Kofleriaceae bacterium]